MSNVMAPSTVDVYVGVLVFFEPSIKHQFLRNWKADSLIVWHPWFSKQYLPLVSSMQTINVTVIDLSGINHVFSEILRKGRGGAPGTTGGSHQMHSSTYNWEKSYIWLIERQYFVISNKEHDRFCKQFRHGTVT